jgi:hypothetical protein
MEFQSLEKQTTVFFINDIAAPVKLSRAAAEDAVDASGRALTLGPYRPRTPDLG